MCMVEVVRVCSCVFLRSKFDTCVLVYVLLPKIGIFSLARGKFWKMRKRTKDGRWTDDSEKREGRRQTRQWRCIRIFFRHDMKNGKKI